MSNQLQIFKGQQLIPIRENQIGQVIVSARDVHEFLKVQQDFSDWIKKQLEMISAKKDKEYSLLKGETSDTGGRPTTEYILTIDTAKEICMIAGIAPRTNEETKKLSKQARQYFIQIEKAWNSPEMIMKRALEIANRRVEDLKLETAQQKQIINELQPKATYYDLILQNTSLMPITLIAKDYGMSGTKMNELLHKLGVQYKQGKGSKATWLLYSKYQDKGYTSSKTQNYVDSSGNPQSKLHTYWTQKGRLFIYDLLKSQGILPTIEQVAESETAAGRGM